MTSQQESNKFKPKIKTTIKQILAYLILQYQYYRKKITINEQRLPSVIKTLKSVLITLQKIGKLHNEIQQIY